jgi:hypothetical protein
MLNPWAVSSMVRKSERPSIITIQKYLAKLVSRGGLELLKYVYLVVLWRTHLSYSEAIFTSPYTYVLASDTRSFRVVLGQSDGKLLTSDTSGW